MTERSAPCRHLCTKKQYTSAPELAGDWTLAYDDPNALFWCGRTMRESGPDGGFVHREDCRPGRDCYLPRW